MRIRKSKETDLERIMKIYARARAFMAETGNPNQWGPTNWPPEELIREDIRKGCSYVCVNEAEQVIGTFYYTRGRDIEPTYRGITDGAWIGEDTYGVVHRIASDGSERGTGTFCLNWAFRQCGHLRIDTHPDNVVMQRLLTGLGFVRCGIIHVVEDDNPRYAYEKVCLEAEAAERKSKAAEAAERESEEAERKEAAVRSRGEQARRLFCEGYSCAQSVVCAFTDRTGLDRDTSARLASSFGGGLGRLREVCGCVSGAALVLGAVEGYADPKDREAKKAHYARVREFAARFRESEGSIICRELLAKAAAAAVEIGGDPEERTAEYYKKRPCPELARRAAEILEDMLTDEKG